MQKLPQPIKVRTMIYGTVDYNMGAGYPVLLSFLGRITCPKGFDEQRCLLLQPGQTLMNVNTPEDAEKVRNFKRKTMPDMSEKYY